MFSSIRESRSELDRLSSNVDVMGKELEKLNSEILYWKSETDKRKIQLGEHLLDDPCDPDDRLWEQLAVREVDEARWRIARNPEVTMAIVTALVRDKQEAMVSCLCSFFGFIFR